MKQWKPAGHRGIFKSLLPNLPENGQIMVGKSKVLTSPKALLGNKREAI